MKKIIFILSLCLCIGAPSNTFADSKGSATGLQIPRFVSLKSKRVNLRVGPGRKYSVQWLYVNPGLPVEIIQEYDQWRQIRDSEGTEGWVFHSLLSGKRTAIIAPWDRKKEDEQTIFAKAYSTNSIDGSIAANLEPGLVVKIESCDKSWCNIANERFSGYLPKPKIWGVYPEEVIEN